MTLRRRKNRPQAAAASPGQRKNGFWLATLFALPFAASGIGMLLLSVLPTLYDWSRMQFWQPVDATLLQAQLVTSRGSKSTTYRATAHYRFEWAGQPVQGQRAAISERSDNIGDFQQQLGWRLERAFKTGRSVPVWVNPSNPHESIIDRSLRPGLLAFKMVFVVMFGGFGVGLLFFLWHDRKAAAAAGDAPASARPWLDRAEWAQGRVRSNKRYEVWVAWAFALVWNLLAVPAVVLNLPSLRVQQDVLAAGGLAVVGLAGLGLLWWSVRATLDARRYGDVRLVLDPFPGAIGGHFGATMVLPLAYQPGRCFAVTLRCIYHYRSRSAGDDDSRSRESVVWQAEGVAQVEPHADGIQLGMRFDVPGGLPATESADGAHHAWRLEVQSAEPALTFARSFDVPVYATGASSARLWLDAAQHPQVQQLRAAQVRAVSELEPIPGGVRLYLPYGRAWKEGLLLVVVGGVFFGAGLLTGRAGASALVVALSGGVGGALLVFAFYLLCNSLRVQLDRQGLRTERRLLGLMLVRHQAPAQDIARLVVRESYSSQSGTQHVTFYRIQVEMKNGKKITVADSLRGRAAAEQLLAVLGAATGYPHAAMRA